MNNKNQKSFTQLFRQNAKGEIDTFGAEKEFGTFHGVYRPTILTILGLMMYLREGWLVGNAGLLGAMLVISLAFLITGITVLSVSTIVSNIRIGRGGVFSLVSQSLGLEVGGSIGIPLFLAQSFSASMYIFGFAEGWGYLFPEHPRQIVLLSVFFLAALLSFLSAKLSFYVQFLVMAGVVAALCSIYGGLFVHQELQQPQWWGDFGHGDFWYLFSIFFPAATGILVGSSMSGNLKEPRKNIAYGTIYAWGTALFVYLTLAVWYSLVERPAVLQGSSIVSISRSLFPQVVVVGILSSCFSAAISSMVAAPRVLQALGQYNLLPFADFFKTLNKGEPRFASLCTSGLVLPLLFFRGIDSIAPFVTQFFISIYFIINTILAIEQGLNLLSFRPTMRWPKFLPLLGSFLCLIAMLVISPVVGIVSVVFIISIYGYLSKKKLVAPWETVQSGIFIALAEWSLRRAILSKQMGSRRAWKPDLIVLVANEKQWRDACNFLLHIVYPQGSLKFIVVGKKNKDIDLLKQIKHQVMAANRRGILANVSMMKYFPDYIKAVKATILSTQSYFLSPNSFMLPLRAFNQKEIVEVSQITLQAGKALIFNINQPVKKFVCKDITLWVRDQSPNWKLSLNLSNLDYALLLAYQLKKNSKARLRLCCVVREQKDTFVVERFLRALVNSARFGQDIEIKTFVGDFRAIVKQNKKSDLHIFGLPARPNKAELLKIYQNCGASCLFVRDSGTGRESALA